MNKKVIQNGIFFSNSFIYSKQISNPKTDAKGSSNPEDHHEFVDDLSRHISSLTYQLLFLLIEARLLCRIISDTPKSSETNFFTWGENQNSP